MALIACQKCRSVVSLGEDDNFCPNCGEMVFDPEDKNQQMKRILIPRIYMVVTLCVCALTLVVFYAVKYYHEIVALYSNDVFLEKILSILTATVGNLFNLFFFIVIFSLFLWGLITFRINVKKTRRALKQGFRFVNRAKLDKEKNRFDELNEKFMKNNFFAAKWYEFHETLKQVNNNGKVGYYNTIDVNYFFNEDTLFLNRFLSSFVFSIPTLLTGIGIFGTFFGLVIGLQPFHSITDFSNSKEVGLLTSQLLSGISTSFLSSLWGIFFSILLNFFLAHGRSIVCQEVDMFSEMLGTIYPRIISIEDEDVREIQKILKRHSEA